MATATYEPIATTTLAVTSASITFSSIPSTYTDLVIVSPTLEQATGHVSYALMVIQALTTQ
jgi:hypothetical protein